MKITPIEWMWQWAFFTPLHMKNWVSIVVGYFDDSETLGYYIVLYIILYIMLYYLPGNKIYL